MAQNKHPSKKELAAYNEGFEDGLYENEFVFVFSNYPKLQHAYESGYSAGHRELHNH